jgi:uncharacterized protein YjbI with pentapeptide repeats
MPASQLSYEESCRRLQEGYLEEGEIPPIPRRMPQADDEEPLGVNFFREFLGDGADLSNLTLPRTFFGRSEINNVFFQNTDLMESNLCWNDFIEVDFSDAILAGCDLRASNFTRVKFVATDLRQSDLRLSSFEECDFTNAEMAGTVLTPEQGQLMALNDKQRTEIAWTADPGPEPDGG